MFNLSHPKPTNDAWAVDPMLFTEKGEDKGFSGQDWDNVPKVAYETALFRKLAPPRMARVVTNPGSFVLETYGSPAPVAKEGTASHEKVNAKADAESLGAAGDIGIDLSKAKESQSALGQSELEGSSSKDAHTSQEQKEDRDQASIEAGSAGFDATSKPLDFDASAELNSLEQERKDHVGETPLDERLDVEGAESEAPSQATSSDTLSSTEADKEGQLNSTSSHGSDEGEQVGLVKDLEQAQAQINDQASDQARAIEEFEAQKQALQSQTDALNAQLENAQANEASLQAKIDALTQALAEKEANLELEREALKAENSAALDVQMKLLGEVTSKLDDFVNHPQRLFEPLKRLSVHIAEQLVLAELNLSGASIERLIQRCLDELSSHSQQTITVELNSQDKVRLQELTGEMFNHIQLHAVSSLQPGSVRVITDDTQVDDLIGHRLEAMANNLLAQPELWREQSPFFKQPLAQRDTEIEDVRQRLTPMVERQEENQDD